MKPFIFMCTVLLANSSKLLAFEYSGTIGIESLGFINKPLADAQHNHYLSGVAELELIHEWDSGSQSLAFVPFYRYSQHDSKRSHFDIRELTWLKASDNWELRTGFRKVFWGVAESQHIIDIINQTDLVENTDTEDKLGQPMINLALIHDWGTLDLYFLTGFRERTFSGTEGRFRSPVAIDVDHPRFEENGAQRHLAYAARWSHNIGDWDLGLAHFYGTGREPTILVEQDASGNLSLIPYYPIINQTSIDIQATKGAWLWKLESLMRSGQGETFLAGTGGLEYTFYNLFDNLFDLGLVSEYLYDSRGKHAPIVFQDDILAALRFGFSDTQSTQILAGVIFDRGSNSKFYNIEASRRLGDSFKLEIEARFFSGILNTDPAFILRDDDHFRAELSYFF
ncbi:MAG: hypothetical protein ISR72_08835 [Methylobacter sp.]|nr:hypothetical protein [Methylobacter sp.]